MSEKHFVSSVSQAGSGSEIATQVTSWDQNRKISISEWSNKFKSAGVFAVCAGLVKSFHLFDTWHVTVWCRDNCRDVSCVSLLQSQLFR